MAWSNTIRRLRDGMIIRCASPELAGKLASELNQIHAPRDRLGRIKYDLVTYVREASK